MSRVCHPACSLICCVVLQVLENHHCASVFELMKNPKFNLLASLSNEQYVRDCLALAMPLG